MNDLRQAAQQALEALDGLEQNYGNLWQTDKTPEELDALCVTLRTALEQDDKDRVWIEERKAAWAKDKEIARKNAELERERHYTPGPCNIAPDGVCEALECCKDVPAICFGNMEPEQAWLTGCPSCGMDGGCDCAALEQPEQTCNCRWVGDVQTQQCTLHEAHIDAIHEWAERAKAAEAKLEQPEQERPTRQMPEWMDYDPATDVLTIHGRRYSASMFGEKGFLSPVGTLLQVAEGQPDCVTLMTVPLEQPEQEPVAWQVHPFDYGIGHEGVYAMTQRLDQVKAWERKGWAVQPLYTHPPHREWRGLTEEDFNSPMFSVTSLGRCDVETIKSICKDAEAALKEKNHE